MVDGREGTKAGRERKDHSPSQQFLNLPLTGDAVKTFSEELNYRQQKKSIRLFLWGKISTAIHCRVRVSVKSADLDFDLDLDLDPNLDVDPDSNLDLDVDSYYLDRHGLRTRLRFWTRIWTMRCVGCNASSQELEPDLQNILRRTQCFP